DAEPEQDIEDFEQGRPRQEGGDDNEQHRHEVKDEQAITEAVRLLSIAFVEVPELSAPATKCVTIGCRCVVVRSSTRVCGRVHAGSQRCSRSWMVNAGAARSIARVGHVKSAPSTPERAIPVLKVSCCQR